MDKWPDVLRRYVEGLKHHDVEAIAATVAENLAFITEKRVINKLQFLAMLRALYTAFPDWRYEYRLVDGHAAPDVAAGQLDFETVLQCICVIVIPLFDKWAYQSRLVDPLIGILRLGGPDHNSAEGRN